MLTKEQETQYRKITANIYVIFGDISKMRKLDKLYRYCSEYYNMDETMVDTILFVGYGMAEK